jgi:hypothetical protein
MDNSPASFALRCHEKLLAFGVPVHRLHIYAMAGGRLRATPALSRDAAPLPIPELRRVLEAAGMELGPEWGFEEEPAAARAPVRAAAAAPPPQPPPPPPPGASASAGGASSSADGAEEDLVVVEEEDGGGVERGDSQTAFWAVLDGVGGPASRKRGRSRGAAAAAPPLSRIVAGVGPFVADPQVLAWRQQRKVEAAALAAAMEEPARAPAPVKAVEHVEAVAEEPEAERKQACRAAAESAVRASGGGGGAPPREWGDAQRGRRDSPTARRLLMGRAGVVGSGEEGAGSDAVDGDEGAACALAEGPAAPPRPPPAPPAVAGPAALPSPSRGDPYAVSQWPPHLKKLSVCLRCPAADVRALDGGFVALLVTGADAAAAVEAEVGCAGAAGGAAAMRAAAAAGMAASPALALAKWLSGHARVPVVALRLAPGGAAGDEDAEVWAGACAALARARVPLITVAAPSSASAVRALQCVLPVVGGPSAGAPARAAFALVAEAHWRRSDAAVLAGVAGVRGDAPGAPRCPVYALYGHSLCNPRALRSALRNSGEEGAPPPPGDGAWARGLLKRLSPASIVRQLCPHLAQPAFDDFAVAAAALAEGSCAPPPPPQQRQQQQQQQPAFFAETCGAQGLPPAYVEDLPGLLIAHWCSQGVEAVAAGGRSGGGGGGGGAVDEAPAAARGAAADVPGGTGLHPCERLALLRRGAEAGSEAAIVGALALLAREYCVYTLSLAVKAAVDAAPPGCAEDDGWLCVEDLSARRQYAHWRAEEHPVWRAAAAATAASPPPPPPPAQALAAATGDAAWDAALAALRGGACPLPPLAPRVPAWPLFVPYVATTLERWHRAQPAAAEKPLRALERLMRDFKWPLPALWWWEASRALIV